MGILDNKTRIGAAILLLFAVVYFNATTHIPEGRAIQGEVFTSRTLPAILAISTMILCLVQLFAPARSGDGDDDSLLKSVREFQWKPFLNLTGLMFLYGILFEYLGFVLATALFLFFGFRVLGESRLVRPGIVATAMALSIWALLTQVFDIHLDVGDLIRQVIGS